MNCCGYDLLLQMDERLLNKALAGLFYTGKLKRSGVFRLTQGIPAEIQGFIQAEYLIRLKNEPYIDFLQTSSVGIRLSVEVKLTVLTGIELELDVDFGANAKVSFDLDAPSIHYDLKDAGVYAIKINDRYTLNRHALERVNTFIGLILKQYLTQDLKEISIPIPLVNLKLPTLPDGQANLLPVRVKDLVIIDDRLIAAGINFFDHTGGSLDQVQDTTGGAELFAAVRKDAMARLSRFWWDHTDIQKSLSFSGALPVDFCQTLAGGKDLLIRGATLGLLQPETQVNHAQLVYDVSITVPELPEYSFSDGDQAAISNLILKVSLKAHLDIESREKLNLDSSGLIPDKITPWTDDRLLREKTTNDSILPIQEELSLTIESAVCSVQTDGQGQLALKVVDAAVELELGDAWYENFGETVVNSIASLLNKTILGRIPAFVISPSLLLAGKEVLGYTFDPGIKALDLRPEEVSLSCSPVINELDYRGIPFPLYIANKKSGKLHRFDCSVVEDIDFTHRSSYYSVYEAVNAGMKPCGECLRGYPK